jgi:hypothetical protein
MVGTVKFEARIEELVANLPDVTVAARGLLIAVEPHWRAAEKALMR